MTNKIITKRIVGKKALGRVLEFFMQEAIEFVVIGAIIFFGLSTLTIINSMVASLGGILIVRIVKTILLGGLK